MSSRAYRQLRSCPLDWPLLGIVWGKSIYIDTAIPFGLRHGASACQRTTEAVTHIAAHDVDATAYPYVDDTGGAAQPFLAQLHYQYILDIMAKLGLVAAQDKCSPPGTTLTWIGVLFDTLAMSMHIVPEKVREASLLCTEFFNKHTVSHKYMERFLGKIFHAIKCCDGARRFTARLLQLLHSTAVSKTATAPITPEARLDASWLALFLPAFNGITLIKNLTADCTVEVDSCLQGGGGLCSNVGYFCVRHH